MLPPPSEERVELLGARSRVIHDLGFNRNILQSWVVQRESPKVADMRKVIDRYLNSLKKLEEIEGALEALGDPRPPGEAFNFDVDNRIRAELHERWVKFMGNAESPFRPGAQQGPGHSDGIQGTKRSRDDDDLGQVNRDHGPQRDCL